MTNKEWLATLSAHEWWDVAYEWLIQDYGKRYTDTRIAVMDWLTEEHSESQKGNWHMKNECCETCKFYKDGWCELFFVEQEPEHKCQSDYESKGNIEKVER